MFSANNFVNTKSVADLHPIAFSTMISNMNMKKVIKIISNMDSNRVQNSLSKIDSNIVMKNYFKYEFE